MQFADARKNVKGWRFCALMDSDKELVKPANGNNKTALQNVQEMEEIINSLPDGTYYLAVRNSPAAKFTYFPFDIGSQKEEPAQLGSSHSAEAYNTDLYAENVRLAVRNKELETLNRILEEKNAEYLQTIDDLENELHESAEQLGEPQGSVMETILMTALPQILEKIQSNEPKTAADAVQYDPGNADAPSQSV